MVLGDTPELTASFEAAAAELNVPFKAIEAASEDLRSVYGAEAILVRPDQFIAWAGSATGADAGAILARAIAKAG